MKVKSCLICCNDYKKIPNLICGHFICPCCYVRLKDKDSSCKCPFCFKKLRRK